jgi:hypothetical protein
MSAPETADQFCHDRFDARPDRVDTWQAMGFTRFLQIDARHFIAQVLGIDGDADAGDFWVRELAFQNRAINDLLD